MEEISSVRYILFSNVGFWWILHLTHVLRREGRLTGDLLWSYAQWSDGVAVLVGLSTSLFRKPWTT